jgi:hypothetical protein
MCAYSMEIATTLLAIRIARYAAANAILGKHPNVRFEFLVDLALAPVPAERAEDASPGPAQRADHVLSPLSATKRAMMPLICDHSETSPVPLGKQQVAARLQK